jgi:hypothetical protein
MEAMVADGCIQAKKFQGSFMYKRKKNKAAVGSFQAYLRDLREDASGELLG